MTKLIYCTKGDSQQKKKKNTKRDSWKIWRLRFFLSRNHTHTQKHCLGLFEVDTCPLFENICIKLKGITKWIKQFTSLHYLKRIHVMINTEFGVIFTTIWSGILEPSDQVSWNHRSTTSLSLSIFEKYITHQKLFIYLLFTPPCKADQYKA